MEATPVLTVYLAFFYEAWKKAYALGWIYHRMVESQGKEATLAFFAAAQEQGYPLVPEACRAHAGTPFFLRAVNQRFSDWVFAKAPDAETFVRNVLKNHVALQASKATWQEANRECAEDLRRRGWEALDSFGGKTKGLRKDQLVYDTRGRKTGKGMSERTWAK